MRLHVLAGGSTESVEAFSAAPFDLAVHPMRPGVAHDAISLVLNAELAELVEQGAAAEGIPTALWAALLIESERALTTIASGAGLDSSAFANELDTVAMRVGAVLPAQRGRRLIRYGLELREGRCRRPARAAPRLTLAVPQHTVIAWECAAVAARQTLTDWAAVLLGHLPRGRVRWESAAALSGQTLAEWVVAQAARRASN